MLSPAPFYELLLPNGQLMALFYLPGGFSTFSFLTSQARQHRKPQFPGILLIFTTCNTNVGADPRHYDFDRPHYDNLQ